MKDIFICSAMPIYNEAAISSTLLKENSEKVLTLMMEKEAQKRYLIVAKGENQIKVPEGIDLIEAERSFGYTYGNYSALIKVVEGEKSIPKYLNAEVSKDKVDVVTVEELLNTDKKKVYIGGKAKKNGIYEFDKQVTPRLILESCESINSFKAMFFGYPMGIILDEAKLDQVIELTTDYIEIIDEKDCMLDRLLAIAEVFTKETCGRCVFGHEGVTQIQMILKDITLKKGKQSDIELILDLCSEMQKQTLCEVGVTIANVIISGMDCFKEEIEEHITRKRCDAGVCAKYITYHILPDLCTGCMDCMDVCEDDAILGKKKFIHVIDQDECIQCGACLEACDEGAIVTAGAIKPRGPKKPIRCK